MKQDDILNTQTYSFMALRKTVGWIGILLPFTLMAGVYFIFRGNAIMNSISQYYHSGMRDVLVGALCAEGLFLLYYKGYNKWDNRTASLAGFFAICVAWFPILLLRRYQGTKYIEYAVLQ